MWKRKKKECQHKINDFILVDKDYIEAYMLIHNK